MSAKTNKMPILWRFLVRILFGLAICLVVSFFIHNLYSSLLKQPGIPRLLGITRQITDNTLNVHEYWRRPLIVIGAHDVSLRLVAVSDQLVFLREAFDRGVGSYLQVFDASSGNLLWGTYESQSNGMLVADVERVYTMADFEVHAYDLKSGQRLWGTSRMPDRRSYSLHLDSTVLYAYDWGKKTIHRFDARTGDSLDSVLLMDDGFILSGLLPQFDLYSNRTFVKAVHKPSQRTLWIADIGNVGPVERTVLVGDVLLASNGVQIFAFDAGTGQIKWYSDDIDFASNFVVVNSSLYAINANARLVQLDVETGLETGYIQFSSARTNVQGGSGYWIAANEQMLFVSFDDSQELIALGS